MRNFKVLTDSTVHLPQEEIDMYGITIVPLSTMLNDEIHEDGSDAEKALFLEKMMASQELPKSSQPSIGRYMDLYNQLTADGSEVLAIMVTHTLSGTVECARQAAALADGKITVIDSEFCARAMAFQVLEAARCAEEGLTVEETLPRIDATRSKTILYISIVDLTNMIKGGRIGRTLGAVSQMLNLKVNLSMINGALEADSKGRGKKSIIKRYEKIIQDMKQAKVEILEVGITHDGLSEYSEKIIQMLREALPHARFETAYASASVMTHAGAEAVSFQFLTK